MQDVSVHPITPTYRRHAALVGLGSLAFTMLFGLLLYLEHPKDIGELIVRATMAGASALCAAWGIRFAVTCSARTVSASRSGIRVGDGDWIEWVRVARVRERTWLQRLDLIGHDERRLASIEYQVEGVDELLDLVRRRVPRVATTPRRRFGRRFSAPYLATSAIVCGAFVALGLWLWTNQGQWIGLFAPVVLCAFYVEFRDQLRELELQEAGLVLRTVLRERVVLRRDIERVELLLKPARNGQLLSVLLILRDGSAVWVQPVGENAYDVHAAVKTWLEPRESAR